MQLSFKVVVLFVLFQNTTVFSIHTIKLTSYNVLFYRRGISIENTFKHSHYCLIWDHLYIMYNQYGTQTVHYLCTGAALPLF